MRSTTAFAASVYSTRKQATVHNSSDFHKALLTTLVSRIALALGFSTVAQAPATATAFDFKVLNLILILILVLS